MKWDSGGSHDLCALDMCSCISLLNGASVSTIPVQGNKLYCFMDEWDDPYVYVLE